MKKVNLLRIFRLVADDSAAIFPYLFAFYIFSVLLSLFFPVWRSFFYWPALHAGIALFAVLSLGSGRMNVWGGEIVETFQKKGAKAGTSIVLAVLVPIRALWRKVSAADYAKLAVITAVLAFSLFEGIDMLSFLILLFGLVSFLFKLDMRIAAGCGLIFLVVTPVLLAFNEGGFAEEAAVYAYYFLVIAVVTQLRVIPLPLGKA